MKFIIAVLLVFKVSITFAQGLVDQTTVDNYVTLAMSNSAEKIKGEGRHRCEYAVLVNAYGTDPQYEARAKNVNEAQQRLALLCIKERCQQVGRWINGSLSYMNQISDADTVEFMRAQGYSETEIEVFHAARSRAVPAELENITCANSVPLGRMVVVDSCFSMPMQCD